MDMTGEQLIPLPRQRVWEALNDPAILKACIPGCDSIERLTDLEYKIAMTAAIGPVKAKFAGKLLLSELNPPESYTLAFEGSGGVAGFGKGDAKVHLVDEGAATRLSYTAHATVGGKLAQVGSRLIDGVAKKMAEEFFVEFNQTIAPVEAGLTSAAPVARGVGAGGIPRWVWLVAAIVIALMMVLFLRR